MLEKLTLYYKLDEKIENVNENIIIVVVHFLG